MTYNELLRKSAKESGNIVCMGLDPVLSVLSTSDKTVWHHISARFSRR